MSSSSTFRVCAKAQRRKLQISGTTPTMAHKVREEEGSRIWRTCGCVGAAFPLMTYLTGLTLQRMMADGETSCVDAARDIGDENDGNAAPRKIDRKMSEGGPIFPTATDSTGTRWVSARSRQQLRCQSSAVPADWNHPACFPSDQVPLTIRWCSETTVDSHLSRRQKPRHVAW